MQLVVLLGEITYSSLLGATFDEGYYFRSHGNSLPINREERNRWMGKVREIIQR